MHPPILAAGLDGRSLFLEAPVLKRDGHAVRTLPSARSLLTALPETGARLVVLGPALPDLNLYEAVGRIRSSPLTRHVSVLALIPGAEPSGAEGRVLEVGANAALRRPLPPAVLESWVAKLLAVPRRVEARIPVQGYVVGTPRSSRTGHFYGLTRNLSTHGMLLASPVPLGDAVDLELELSLTSEARVRALGRVVREASEVSWPYVGYGVEFLYVAPDSLKTIEVIVAAAGAGDSGSPAPVAGIHSTFKQEPWIYEIREPVRSGPRWCVEIRRAPHEQWRPGTGGPFYVVEGTSAQEALDEARVFLERRS